MQQQQSLFNWQKTDVRHLVTKSQLIEIMLKDGLSSGQIRDYFINIRGFATCSRGTIWGVAKRLKSYGWESPNQIWGNHSYIPKDTKKYDVYDVVTSKEERKNKTIFKFNETVPANQEEREVSRTRLLQPSKYELDFDKVESKTTFGDKEASLESKSFKITTVQELLDYCEVDQKVWQVDSITTNKWEMGYVDNDGEAQTKMLVQIKAKLKRIEENAIEKISEDTLADIERMGKEYNNTFSKLFNKWDRKSPNLKKDKLLEVCIFDAHINKLCEEAQSGHEWNHNIATRVYLNMIDRMVERGLKEECNRVLFVVGNDFLQVDNLQSATTKGTRVDSSQLYFPASRLAKEILIEAVTRLRVVGEVDVVIMGGNHDKVTTFFLGEILEAFFRNTKGVTVDNGLKSRKYYQYGKNMIMFSHWDGEKIKNIPNIMATEMPIMWSKTIYREAHLWHLHHQKTFGSYEECGVIVRHLNSISGTDQWHYENWFVGNLRGATAMIWDAELGKEWEYNFNLSKEDLE